MLVCEAGLNHRGCEIDATMLLSAVISDNNVDAITFQVREPSFYENSKFAKMKLSLSFYGKMINIAHKNNKKFGIALSDANMFNKFNKLNVDFYKILSKDLENIEFLDCVSKVTSKKIYLSTGLSSINAIRNALKVLSRNDVTLIHTRLSNKVKDVNLKAIDLMKKEFSNNIAYGHHCENLNILFAAKALEPSDMFLYIRGNDKTIYPDHNHAVPVSKLDYYTLNIKNIEKSIGSGVKLEVKNTIEGQL